MALRKSHAYNDGRVTNRADDKPFESKPILWAPDNLQNRVPSHLSEPLVWAEHPTPKTLLNLALLDDGTLTAHARGIDPVICARL
jgi:hypothetical protein